jgi:TPP-dependent pyruvate/acetoin dehydrogenase alpha subunit
MKQDTSQESAPHVPRDRLLAMFERMALIRSFEQRASKLYADAEIHGGMHLCVGQEAVAVGVCESLRESDYITSTHRPHGHCLAKGMDVRRMMAELYGRRTGICGGKGGSMHLADLSLGMLGANGVVGAGAPLACGAGLTAKILRTDQVVVCFFGDGAAEQGTTHEAMNLAAIWSLPVVFVCENNGFAQTTPVSYHCSVQDIAQRADAYGMPGDVVDGTDVLAMLAAATTAVDRARRGEGPSLVEAKTLRHYGHFEGDQQTYRSKSEKEMFGQHDPILKFSQVLIGGGIAPLDLEDLSSRAEATVDAAVEAARADPDPEPGECLTDVYVSY